MQYPIVNAGLLYLNGLNLSYTSTTTITVAAGACRDSTNVNDIVSASALTPDITVAGANGLDTGSVAATTMYAVYAIGSSASAADAASLFSTSFTSPTLPNNYDMFRRIGAVLTDGSSHILAFWQYGEGMNRTMYYDVGISELSGGTSATYAAINLASSVPPVACQVIIDIAYTANSATNVAQFLPYGSTATNGIVRFGCGVAAAQVGQVTVPCELNSSVPTIQYKLSSASDALTLLTTGYVDILS